MLNFIAKLHQILNQFKGIETAYTTSNKNQMIIHMDDQNYKITVEKLDDRDIIEHVEEIR